MSTYDKLDTINDSLNDIKTAIIAKGQTPSGNITTYAAAIDDINIVNNTTLNVTPTTSAQSLSPSSPYTGYGTVEVSAVTASIDANITAGNIKKDVNILGITGTYEGGIGIPREVSVQGVYQTPKSSFTFSLPSDVTDIGRYGLAYAFIWSAGLTSVDLSSLTTVSGAGESALTYSFGYCTSLTSVDLSSLTTVSAYYCFSYAFYGCTNLTSISFPALTTINGGNAFANAFSYTNLTSISFPVLNTIQASYVFANAFQSTKLTSISFPALTTTSFGSYTGQFQYMMSGTSSTVTHTIHFPSNLESTIQGLSGYPLFGGTSGYVVLAFDLPATS